MLYCNHYRKLFLSAIMILFVACAMAEAQSKPVDLGNMETLVTTEWLNEHLNDKDLIILDCTVYMVPDSSGSIRPISGRGRFEEGHIPSAGFADLTGDLCDADSPLGFALPTPQKFCAAMSKLGVDNDSRVVLYDAYNSVWAARVWWMLRWVGFDRVALLDGGLKAWTSEGRQLSTKPADHLAGRLTPKLQPEAIADRDEVFTAISDDAVHIIDALPEAHFRGKMVMYGRPGHITSARNVSALSLLDESGRYRASSELTGMFTGDRKDRYITYCGAGVAASSDAFILTRLGFQNVTVYMGSLQEWVADPANPMTIDE